MEVSSRYELLLQIEKLFSLLSLDEGDLVDPLFEDLSGMVLEDGVVLLEMLPEVSDEVDVPYDSPFSQNVVLDHFCRYFSHLSLSGLYCRQKK